MSDDKIEKPAENKKDTPAPQAPTTDVITAPPTPSPQGNAGKGKDKDDAKDKSKGGEEPKKDKDKKDKGIDSGGKNPTQMLIDELSKQVEEWNDEWTETVGKGLTAAKKKFDNTETGKAINELGSELKKAGGRLVDNANEWAGDKVKNSETLSSIKKGVDEVKKDLGKLGGDISQGTLDKIKGLTEKVKTVGQKAEPGATLEAPKSSSSSPTVEAKKELDNTDFDKTQPSKPTETSTPQDSPEKTNTSSMSNTK